VSAAVYEEFEAPLLARIGQSLGPYAIHACGSWERTVPSARLDPRLRAMNGQIRENDLATLCDLARGDLILSINPSRNLHERYLWPDTTSFLGHVLATVPAWQPLEVRLEETDLDLWRRLFAESRDRLGTGAAPEGPGEAVASACHQRGKRAAPC